MRNLLPPTVMDSFVWEAKEHKELIYGDEGIDGPPPFELFSKPHRINTGILDTRDAGLTTGHGDLMPDATGRDEFLGQEWSLSGARGVSAADGFYEGLPYRTPGSAGVPGSFPAGYQTLDWTGGQIDESRWGTPLPVAWNSQNTGSVGADRWTPLGDGSWISEDGRVISPDGTTTFTKDVQYDDGSYMGFAGDVILRGGQPSSSVVPLDSMQRSINQGAAAAN
jgi:hypothetical protein